MEKKRDLSSVVTLKRGTDKEAQQSQVRVWDSDGVGVK